MLAGVFILLNQIILVAVRGDSGLMIWPALIWAIAAGVGHNTLRRLPDRDPFIFPVVMLLAGWGLNLVDRLAPAFALRQVLWVITGVVAMIFVTGRPRILRLLRRYPYTWLVLGTSLLVFTVIFGVNPSGYGARLWLNVLGFGYFQPSEVLKILLVVYLASYLANHGERLRTETVALGPVRAPSPAVMGPLLTMWGLSCVVLVWQRDLGTATLFFLVFLAMLYMATGQRNYVLVGLGLLVIAATAAYFLFDVVRLRIDIWLNPWPESQGRAYQIVQSLLAFSAGGVVGQGIGMGSPTYIPVVHSDFVFAAIAEEWGLAGSLTVVGCIALLVVRGLRIAAYHAEAERRFNALLATGLSVTLAAQALLIMGGVLKLVPLTGVTLPFVSYGGSSLLGSFILVGLLLLLSGPPPPEPKPEPLARRLGRLVRRLLPG